MDLKKLKIGDLKIATYNPRKELSEKDKEYQKIKNSILEFGYVAPVVVNSDMTVISGHQRLKILKDLKYEEIDCIVVNFDKNKEKLLNIALNKISGEWDYQKLESIFNELENSDIDLSITGFEEKEINKILKETEEIMNDNSIMIMEKDSLKNISNKLTEEKINEIIVSWRNCNVLDKSIKNSN